jgi:flagellar hook-basal body complex protein FliE
MDINAISRATPAPEGSSPLAVGGKALDSFGEALSDAVRALNQIQREADTQAAGLATGETVELHDVMLAQERAALGLELAVQVRNKLVEAYQEVMRMQI